MPVVSFATTVVLALLGFAAALAPGALAAQPVQPALVAAQAGSAPGRAGYEGVVEAVRQTVVAAQVPGAVVELAVRAGEAVRAGQLLVRLDARSADQGAAAVQAQVQAARAAQDVATREYARQQQLYAKNYISRAALDQAEAQFKATRAQVAAQLAQAGAAQTQTALHTVRAPYAGVVSEVAVQLGDMAMPGRALLTLYDPAALRVTAALPQSVVGATAGALADAVRIELPGLAPAQQWPAPARVQLLPTVDAATHTQQIRADLPAGLQGAAPGMFARVWLPLPPPLAGQAGAASAGQRVLVPLSALVRRAEMTGVYVQGQGGKPLLRQVRLGRVDGERVELLTGVAPGEQVIADPQAATRAQ